MKRQMPNSVGVVAKPLSTVKPLNSTTQMVMAFLRPILSDGGAEDQGPGHHAEQRIAAQGTRLQRGEVPLFHQHGQDHTVDDEVVAVEDDDERAPEQHHPME